MEEILWSLFGGRVRRWLSGTLLGSLLLGLLAIYAGPQIAQRVYHRTVATYTRVANHLADSIREITTQPPRPMPLSPGKKVQLQRAER